MGIRRSRILTLGGPTRTSTAEQFALEWSPNCGLKGMATLADMLSVRNQNFSSSFEQDMVAALTAMIAQNFEASNE